LKTTLTFLKENSDAKEVEGVSQKFLAYCEEVKEKLAG